MLQHLEDRARRARRLCRVYPADAVTRHGVEVPAPHTGLPQGSVEDVWRSVVDVYETGLYPALGLTIRHRGELVLDRVIGHSIGNAPDDPPDVEPVQATPATLFSLFSASKVVTAMLVHALDDAGKLHLDDRVVEYVPEFGRHGKERVTLRHVLTHTAGIPIVPGDDVDVALLARPDEIVRLLCDARPTSVAGRRLAYHALTGGYILQAVIERVTGKGIRQVLDELVRQPLGMKDFTYGVAEADLPRVARHAITGPRARGPHGWLLRRSLGITHEQAVEYSNDPRYLTAVVPSGNIMATAEETCRFFECLRNDGRWQGRQVFDRRTVHRATAEQTYLELDSVLMMPIRYGMGFMLGGRHSVLFGHRTEQAFGHLGFTNVVCWADPERHVSVAFMNTGKPFLSLRLLKWAAVMRAISDRFPSG